MRKTKILGAVSPYRKLEYAIDGGICHLAGHAPFQLKAQAGEIRGYNARFVRLMEKVHKRSLHDLHLDPVFLDHILEELKDLGLAAYRDLGEQFCDYWKEYDALHMDLNIIVNSSSYPLLWEWLYTGSFEEQADKERFWGYRHRIIRRFVGIDNFVEGYDPPVGFLFNQKTSLKHVGQEMASLREICEMRMISFETLGETISKLAGDFHKDVRKRIITAWTNNNFSFIHLATHLHPDRDESLPDRVIGSFIDLSSGDAEISLPLYLLTAATEQHHFKNRPLVFLNACKTLDSEHLLQVASFPNTFMELGANAVIATTCNVPDLFAKEFAKRFYENLFDTETENPISPGEALVTTRRQFLEEFNNPLGFAYVMYSKEDLPIFW